MAGSPIVHLNDENFDEGVSKGIVLVDFYADWCGPCRMLAPVVEKLAQDKDMAGKLKVAKVDTDSALNVASKYNVNSIPTLILFKDGVVQKSVVGLKDFESLKKMVSAVL